MKSIENGTSNGRRAYKMSRIKSVTNALSLVAALTVFGVLSTSSEAQTPARATGASADSAAVTYGRVEKRVPLPDGQYLLLAADGSGLTLWDAAGKRAPSTHKLPQARPSASISLLPTGRVLIWGGADRNGNFVQGGVWFDPELKVVEPAPNLRIAARMGHTATVLTDGRILFAGGRSEREGAEIWDERANRSISVPYQGVSARYGHRAQLQADGNVHLRGGGATAALSSSSDVAFDPDSHVFKSVSRPKDNPKTAPALAASLPLQGQSDVDPGARLSARFTAAVRMQDLNPSNVVLIGPGGVVAARVTPVEGGRLVFVTPDRSLFPDSKYTLMIDGVRTLDGNRVPFVAVDFRTAFLPKENDIETGVPALANAAGSLNGQSGCTSGDLVALCRGASTLKDGVWTPGRNNTNGRWRLVGDQPVLPQASLQEKLRASGSSATVRGVIRRVDGEPVADVDVSIGKVSTRTDRKGEFMLANVPSGMQELYVDGTTANKRDVEYGQFVVGVDLEDGGLTQIPYTMYLPRVTERDKVKIPSPLIRDVVLKHPDMPGLMVHIPAGTVIRDRKGRLVRELALVPTPVNRAPFPVAANYPMYFTLEPGGAVIQGLTPEAAKGIRVFYPNYDKYAKGTQANFWIYDPKDGWRVYGKGRVTTDGRHFSPEGGVALHQTMGASYSVSTDDEATEPDRPPCHEACGGGAGSGNGATAGDPIDLFTGEFSYAETDIAVNDVVPISLDRNYRPRDFKSRSFGLGTATSYDYKLNSPLGENYNVMNLVLPSGVPVKFDRISGSGLSGEWRQNGSVTSLHGASLKFLSDTLGRGYRLTSRDGSAIHFDAYKPNSMLWSMDRFGNRTEFVYDAGLMTHIVSPSGRSIKLTYDADNRISRAVDPLGQEWKYSYNQYGLLSKVTYPDETFKQYRYESWQSPDFNMDADPDRPVDSHRLKEIVDRRGNLLLRNEFELQTFTLPTRSITIPTGRVISQTQADGGVVQIEYGHTEETSSGVLVTNPDGSMRRVVFFYRRPFPKSDTVGYGTPLAKTYQFERAAGSGRLSATIDPTGRRTEYQHDSDGNVTRVTYLPDTADQRVLKFSYNRFGDLKSTTDPIGRVTTLDYSNGCLTSVRNPMGETVSIACNIAGQPLSITDPLGSTWRLDYQDYDVAQVVDPLGRSTNLRYDGMGRLIASQDAEGNVMRTEYGANGEVARVLDAAGNATEIAYDPNGNIAAVLLPNGNGITYQYDVRNRLTTRTDGLSQAETWTYDVMDRPATYTDRMGQTTAFQHDVLGQMTRKIYADATTIDAEYDDAGRLRALVDSAAGTLRWNYNRLDELTEVISDQGVVRYQYDEASRRTTMAAANQAVAEYQYDGADRLTRILQGNEVVQHAYDAAGRLLTTTLPNDVQTGYAYNAANQITGIAWKKPGAPLIGDLGYGYNSVGRIVSQTGTYAPQLLPAASTGANAFDDNQRQTKFNGQSLIYDSNGNLTNDGTRTYVWNARNQMVRIEQGRSVIASFEYDAMGRRTGRVEGSQATGYLYDGLNAVQEVNNGVVNPILVGLGIDQRYARSENGGRTYFLTDHLGSTRALTDGVGAAVNRYDYDAYGRSAQTSNGFSNPYQYTGRERDGNGLYYYRARYYSASIGRFVSEDPIGLAGGLNTYAYVGGDPISNIDPLGLEAVGYNRKHGWGYPAPGSTSTVLDILRNRAHDMQKKNVIGGDKFYHCLAMCESSSRGPLQASLAMTAGVARELNQQYRRGDPAEECAADNRANGLGIAAGLRGQNCVSSCSGLMPSGMTFP